MATLTTRTLAALLLLAAAPALAGRADIQRCINYLAREGRQNTTVMAISDDEFKSRGWDQDLGHHSFAKPSRIMGNGRAYLAFGGPVAQPFTCSVFVRSSMLVPLQHLVAAHELAHCRFARFFERNASHLSWRIPAPWAYSTDDGTLWIDKDVYLLMSERYALGTETLLKGLAPTPAIQEQLTAMALESLGLAGTDAEATAAYTLWSLFLGRHNGALIDPTTAP